MKIGFIGLGQMGAAIAGNLLRAGFPVTAWNRSREPLDRLAAEGATAAADPRDALQGDVLISMLANDAAIREIGLDGPWLDRAAKGLIHVNMATISVDLARAAAAAHAQQGFGYVSAPVFGRPDAAQAARLIIAAAGDPATLEKLSSVFAAIGRQTVIVGEAPEQASLFKIAGNFMIASAMEMMGEAFALLRKGGVNPAQFHEVMANSLFAGPVFQNYGKMIVEERYEPAGFAMALGLKDVNLTRQAAVNLEMIMPLAEILRTHFEDGIARGWSNKDWSALGAVIAAEAGLP
jgi:3-hydroxyisobutyrate dehydrogenase-like beta-hydroxyacid dehydrogenase